MSSYILKSSLKAPVFEANDSSGIAVYNALLMLIFSELGSFQTYMRTFRRWDMSTYINCRFQVIPVTIKFHKHD